MPVLPQVSPNCQAVGKVCRKHPMRRPCIDEPGVDGIGSIRHPDRAEMGAVFVGGIRIFLKLEPPCTHPLQQPPKGFVAEFGEIADRILRLGHRRALVGADTPGDGLVDSISRFHASTAGRGVFAVALDAHGCGQTGAVPIQIKFPPPIAIGKPHLLLILDSQMSSQRAFPPLRTVRESFPSHGAPSIQLFYYVI